MDENIVKRNETLARTLIRNLESRHMKGYYAPNKAEALKLALSLIPEGSSIGMGGAQSVTEIGLKKALMEGNYHFIDRDSMEDKRKAYLECYDADFFLSSANAISLDGVLVNIDGNANRVSAIAYGPRKVLFIVGMNKVAPDTEAAISRARHVAAPINAQRFPVDTPCKKTGDCMDCRSPQSICCQMLLTRFSRDPERIHVILVGEELGF